MKHLFIGGVADGQWIEVPVEATQWNVMCPPDYTIANFRFDRYVVQKWRSGPATREVFIKSDLDKNSILDILLKGYKCTSTNTSA